MLKAYLKHQVFPQGLPQQRESSFSLKLAEAPMSAIYRALSDLHEALRVYHGVQKSVIIRMPNVTTPF